jgi:hypothetical protein
VDSRFWDTGPLVDSCDQPFQRFAIEWAALPGCKQRVFSVFVQLCIWVSLAQVPPQMSPGFVVQENEPALSAFAIPYEQ